MMKCEAKSHLHLTALNIWYSFRCYAVRKMLRQFPNRYFWVMWNFIVFYFLHSLFPMQECVDRAESRWNKAWNDRWSLVLINWFSTAGNPLQPCLNSFTEIRDKLITCHDKFGFWANFVAVNYYTAGSGGGAFQVVKWLNNMLRRKYFGGVGSYLIHSVPAPSSVTPSSALF